MAVYRRSTLWRLGSDPVTRLWSGFGDLDAPPDALDPTGARYRGAGALLDVPALKVLLNGLADRQDFSVSGVSPETVRLALEDRDTIRDAALHVGYVLFDREWQVLAGPVWEWRGVADTITITREDGEAGGTRTISLSVRSDQADRSNPRLAWWTDADQRRRSAGDRFCSRVAGLNQGSSRRFGPR